MKNLNKAQSQFLIYLGGHGKPDSDELYELIELAKSLEIPNKVIGEMRVFRDKLAQVSAKKGELEEAKQEAIDQWGIVKGVAETDGDLVDQAIEAKQGHDEPKQEADEWDLEPPVSAESVGEFAQVDLSSPDNDQSSPDNAEPCPDKGFNYYDPTLPTSSHDCGARFINENCEAPISYHVEKHPFGLTYRICMAEYRPDGNHAFRTVQLGGVSMFDTPQEAFNHLMAHAKENKWAMIDTVKAEVEA